MSKFDVGELKRLAAGRGAEILSNLAGIPREHCDGRHHPCHCGGVDRFRFDPVKEFAICSKCFSSGNGDVLAALQHFCNWDFRTTLERLAEYLGAEANRGEASSPSTAADPLLLVARQKHVTVEGLQAYGATVTGGAVVIPAYDPTGEQCTTFRMKPGSGKAAKGLFESGKPAGVFLPHVEGQVRVPRPGEKWLVFEGPKDPAAAWSQGHLAVGLPTCKLNKKFCNLFRGVDVTFVPDRDVAGDTGAQAGAALLYRLAVSVRVAVLPDEIKERHGADYRDILQRPDGERSAQQALEAALLWTPPVNEPEANGDALSIWRDESRTDIANGKRLIRRHGDAMRYVSTWEGWTIYSGKRWQIDAACEAESRAKDISADLWREIEEQQPRLAAMGDEREADKIRATFKSFARSTSSALGVRNLLTMAKSEPGIAIDHNRFDADPWLLNVANGTLDLSSGRLRPHERQDYQTKLCPVSFDIDAECPLWLKFIRDVTCGDDELAGYLRRFVGHCLTGDTREHVLAFAYGVGANGKSVFVHVVRALLGDDYSIQAAPELLMSRHSETHPTERADLCGKRFVVTTEVEAGRRLNESLVKDLTGGDRIRARRMREDFWEFTPQHKVLMVGNHKPLIRGTDNGIWRRLKLIPFARVFALEEQDKDLPHKLLAELPGILNWALFRCLEWQSGGLGEPAAVQLATAEYRDSQDTIAAFLADCCVEVPSAKVRAGQLYERFKAWAEASGERPLGNRTFGEEIGKRFRKSISNGVWYEGVGVNGEV